MATGSTNPISRDGITWTVVGLTGDIYNHRGVIYGNGTFIIFSDREQIMTSADGIHWTAQTLSSGAPINGITYKDTVCSVEAGPP
jgi:hypothetical protein